MMCGLFSFRQRHFKLLCLSGSRSSTFEKSLEERLEEMIKNTKEYAKRQIRWFRRQGWIEIPMERL